jgi:hypothetical protein
MTPTFIPDPVGDVNEITGLATYTVDDLLAWLGETPHQVSDMTCIGDYPNPWWQVTLEAVDTSENCCADTQGGRTVLEAVEKAVRWVASETTKPPSSTT